MSSSRLYVQQIREISMNQLDKTKIEVFFHIWDKCEKDFKTKPEQPCHRINPSKSELSCQTNFSTLKRQHRTVVNQQYFEQFPSKGHRSYWERLADMSAKVSQSVGKGYPTRQLTFRNKCLIYAKKESEHSMIKHTGYQADTTKIEKLSQFSDSFQNHPGYLYHQNNNIING